MTPPMSSLKNKLQTISVMLCFLSVLNACSSSKPTENSGIGTIRDLYNETGVPTDNLGEPIEIVRNIEDKYPELREYSSADYYSDIYVPLLNACFPTSDWTVLESNAEYITVQNNAEPTAVYTFGRISDIHPTDDSEYALFSAIYPLTRSFRIFPDKDPEPMEFYHVEVNDVQQDTINGEISSGYLVEAVADTEYCPGYMYLVFKKDGSDAVFELMTTDNICAEGESRDEGFPKEKFVLDTRRIHDGESVISATAAAPDVEYKVYRHGITLAIPAFLEVTELENGGYRFTDREGEYTPFVKAGATVFQVSEGASTKEQIDLLIDELNDQADLKDKMSCIDLQYEEGVDFMGVSNATHLHGILKSDKAGLKVRTDLCGTGKIVFDIYAVTRNEKHMVVMFYRSEAQDEEFMRFIEYNTY